MSTTDIDNARLARLSGEKWSHKPACACPVIGYFMCAWNEALGDEPRERLLKPLVPLIVGSKSTPEVGAQRSFMALDWLIRVFTPKWLDLVPELHEHATALRDLDAITDPAGAAASGKRVSDARAAAHTAGLAAARSAGLAAAWCVARPAARDATGAAAGPAAWNAAWNAPRDAAGAAAWSAGLDACWAAAGDVGGAALATTTEWLQASAVDLVYRMLAVGASK